ncbi:hypothetical protein NAEGRDRAFT_79152 [Naegleria gruberi]|uniref:Mif2/CENP-C cupin domain-containing protein n=1 Tax=Naegleria gruberi TaxID=5762 RepID=D2V9X5_NAEGR|nr:uncharacterized protein NAEGRDRAFT_79152 [Naegleria gruberi]EFC46326.1 hypothetical protein NAEGRDRAFT_79152 [Naegleria gruberi]|eukprot:XP_002679070.1 hypothetical protein NAEGRDRAFT_79152 [Naegleria gruberi strain NEG-M]
MNNERQDGFPSASNSNQQPSSSNANNQQPPIMGPPSASLTAALFAERAPRRSALQTREGTGYIPRTRQREGYDDVLASQNAFQNIGKRSGQIIVNTDSVDPNAFFEANNNQNFNQQLHRDDQSSVLSLSNITMNDSDDTMSMLSSKTAVTFRSSGDEQSPDEALKIDKTSMEYVTSSSEDDTSVKIPTVTIKQPKKPDSPKISLPPVSPVLDTFREEEQPAEAADIIAPPTPTPTFDIEQGGLDDDHAFDNLFEEQEEQTFQPEPKKRKISEPRKTKKYIYEKSSSSEEEQDDDESDDRENRRSLKSRQQKQALKSFPASLPQSEPESESEYESDKSSQPKATLEDSGIGPTQLEKSNVDLGRDFYRDEEVKLSQKQTELIGEKYVLREALLKDIENVDETDDEEAKEVNEKVYKDDEDFNAAVSENEEENDMLNTTLISTQNEDVDNGTDPLGIQTSNSVDSRLRRKVTKPCKFWENERPLPKEAGKLMKVKPVVTEPEKKKKAPVEPRKRKVDPLSDVTDGIYKVMNEFGEEEDVKIYATAQMHQSSHFKFRKDETKAGGYATIKANEDTAQLSIYSSLTEKGVGVGTIIIQPGGIKPSSNTSTQSEVLYILKGQASVVVHTNPAIQMKLGSVIHIPPFNSYSMKNIGRGECHILYVFSDTKDRSEQDESEQEEEQDHQVLTKEQHGTMSDEEN